MFVAVAASVAEFFAASVAVVWAAVASLASVAVASDSGVAWMASDEAAAWSCVLVRVSWCVLVGSEGRSLAAWGSRMEGGYLKGQHCPHSQAPWSLQGPRILGQRRRTGLQGCWLGGRGAWSSGSAEGQEPEPQAGSGQQNQNLVQDWTR